MKKLLSLLLAISMMASMLSGMVVFASEGPVIIYEENFDKDALPSGWELPAKASMQSEYAKTGNAIRIVDDSDTTAVHVKSPYIDIVGGELYSASAELLSLSSTEVGISFKFFDAEMVQVKTAQYYTTNDEFTQVSAVLTAPENAVYCRVFFISNGATISEGFFDDVRVVKGVIWPDKLTTMIPPKQSDPVDGQLIKPVDDMLEYNTYNDMGDKLGDFSKAGFYNGEYELPDSSKLEVVATIEPSDDPTADDTDRIQAVIDDVYNNAANDYFKVIKLKAGRYNINSYGLNLKSGIILSGEGQGPEGTVLYATDAKRYTVVKIVGVQNKALTDNHYILDEYVPAGSNKISLSDEDIKNYKVGDLVTICHDGTEEWSAAMEMDGIIDVYGDPTYWSKGKTDMKEERYIEAIHGNTITFDMPFYVPYDTKYSPVYIYKTDDSGRMEHIGIENLRIESSFNIDPNDEKHADNAISIEAAKNCFVRDVSVKYITLSAVVCENGAKQITVKNCSYLEPVSTVAGGRRYAFYAAQKSQQIYFTGCYAYNGRHDFMASYTATGPIVFTDNVDDYSNAQNETHGTWSTGVLYDNLFVVGNSTSGWLGLTNRGHYGTTASQGWTTAGSVAWNCLSPVIIAHKPPLTYQNFIIGEWGHYSDEAAKSIKQARINESKNIYKTAVITEPQPENFATSDNTSFVGDAYKESETAPVDPRSLYKAQLAERLTGSYKNTKPNAPIITSPRGEEEHKLTSNAVTVSGIYQKGAEKVTVYIDNVAHNATINNNDYSFALNVNLADGTHKIYATQTIDGVESTKCADRFVVINEMNGNPDYLQSQYDYDMIHQLINDDVVSYDEYQKVNCVTNENGYGELMGYSVVVADKSAGIKDAKLHYNEDSSITVVLPAETYIVNENKITITVTNKSDDSPVKNIAVVVSEDSSDDAATPKSESGKTDEDGKMVAPSISVDISDLDDIDITRYDTSMDATITEENGTYIVSYKVPTNTSPKAGNYGIKLNVAGLYNKTNKVWNTPEGTRYIVISADINENLSIGSPQIRRNADGAPSSNAGQLTNVTEYGPNGSGATSYNLKYFIDTVTNDVYCYTDNVLSGMVIAPCNFSGAGFAFIGNAGETVTAGDALFEVSNIKVKAYKANTYLSDLGLYGAYLKDETAISSLARNVTYDTGVKHSKLLSTNVIVAGYDSNENLVNAVFINSCGESNGKSFDTTGIESYKVFVWDKTKHIPYHGISDLLIVE